MKSYRMILVLFAWIGIASPVWAQGPDEATLNLMQSALKEWFAANPPEGVSRGVATPREKAFYRPGYGLSLPTPTFRTPGAYTISTSGSQVTGLPSVGVQKPDQDEMVEAITDVMQRFLEQYGDLVGNLPTGEKIVLTYRDTRSSRSNFVFSTGGDNVLAASPSSSRNPKIEITVAVPFDKLLAYRKGSINQDALYKAMEVTTQMDTEPESPSFGMLKALLEPSINQLAAPYFEFLHPDLDDDRIWAIGSSSRRLSYELVQGYGAKYTYRYGRSLRFKRACNCPDDDEDSGDIDKGELDKVIDEQAKVMEEEIPTLLVRYGRTLRDLEADEFLELTIAFPACEACKASAGMTFVVDGETLKRHDRGELTLDGAVSKVTMTLDGAAKDAEVDGNTFFLRGDAGATYFEAPAIQQSIVLPKSGGSIIIENGQVRTIAPAVGDDKED